MGARERDLFFALFFEPGGDEVVSLINGVAELEELEVFWVDHTCFGKEFPVQSLLPEVRIENHDRHLLRVLIGLDKREHFEGFVERSESAWENHERTSHAQEPVLTDKEITELQVQFVIDVRVAMLFERQLDVQADRRRTHVRGSAVAGFHNARTTTRHDGVAVVALVNPLAELGSEFTSGIVRISHIGESVKPCKFLFILAALAAFFDFVGRERTGRTKEHDRILDLFLCKNLCRLEKFRKESNGACGIAFHKFGVVVCHLPWNRAYFFRCHNKPLFRYIWNNIR